MSSRATLAAAGLGLALTAALLGPASAIKAPDTGPTQVVRISGSPGSSASTLPATTAITAAPPASGPAASTRSSAPVVRIRRYADAPGSQRAIDACRLVLWTLRPLWLAGHNYCGFQWMAHLRVGTVVRVTSGRAAGRYVVTGHRRLARQSGALPAVRADLVLQTCVGRGTGLTLARRMH